VLTAGKADETVADGNGVRPGHSIFTAHLLDGLEGAASSKEGIITASGVMAYVYDRVARDQYSHQTPHYGFVDGDGDFIFDTSLLDAAHAEAKEDKGEGKTQEGSGEVDILINTSPQISSAPEVSTSVADTVKGLLSDPTKRIKLDDFVSLHVKRVLDATDLRHFPMQGDEVNKDSFNARINKYEEIVRDLQQILILIAKWGDSRQLRLLETALSRLAEADKGGAGLVVWLHLTWYPIMVLMYSAGISALANQKYDALKIVLQTMVQAEPSRDNAREPLIVPVMSNMTDLHDAFKYLTGQEQKYVP